MRVPDDFNDRNVCIIGLGYVGLTLAVAMAEVGYEVRGVERDPKIIEVLKGGKAHFAESGLDARLGNQLANGSFSAHLNLPTDGKSSVYIITVGTPIDHDKRTMLGAMQAVAGQLRDVLKQGDLVILRSTVRIGISRDLVKPILDEAGCDYDLAFCPERTLEGRALEEIKSLPQIIGGLDDTTCLRATQLFNFLTPTTIKVRDLETAEMIKLVNNTQRDLMFAFANEVADFCDSAGISATEVIRAGNMGYPRASMPQPGPVGGPCLEKDPYILAEGLGLKGGEAQLALQGRVFNETLPQRVVEFVSGELERQQIVPKCIAILGLAFKGQPETDDLRGSLAAPLINRLKERYPEVQLKAFDPALPAEFIEALGIANLGSAQEAFAGADAVIFQNNNAKFENLNLSALSHKMAPKGLIYDLWNQFDAGELKLENHVGYCGLGSQVNLALFRSN